jgi:hypothetical protein
MPFGMKEKEAQNLPTTAPLHNYGASRNSDTHLRKEKDSFRLYIGNKYLYFATFEEAKQAAEKFMRGKPELRIEALTEIDGPDFWAYEYKNNLWVPS